MTTWHAIFEWTADPGPDDAVRERLIDALADHEGGLVMPPDDDLDRWSTSIALDAGTIRQAADAAIATLNAATRDAGQRRVQILALDVVDSDGFRRRMEQPAIPPLIGSAGAAKLAGIKPQRARQIARDDPRHPKPVAHVEEYGDLYLRSQMEDFYANRTPRKPGRPPKVEQDAPDGPAV